MEDPDQIAVAVGSMASYAEAAQLEHVLVYEGSEEIHDLCRTAHWRYRGIPMERIDLAREVMLTNLPWLQWSRKTMCGLTLMSQTPPAPYHPDM